jgi:hypothetical protein
MKFIIFCFFITLITFNSFSQTRKEADIRKEPLDIAEYFLIIPSEKDWVIPGEVYNLFVDRQKILKGGPKKVLLDKKNGYLSIIDEVNGLEFKLEMCYFIRTDKTKTIAVSYYQVGGDCDSRLLKFYTYSNAKWTDITKTVLPMVSLKDYGIAEKDFMPIDFIYKIPQFGTSIYVDAKFPCEQDERLRGKDMMPAFNKYKAWALKKLELKWNKGKGIFEKGGLK